jgi:putative tricarboxylic transport membrane protein
MWHDVFYGFQVAFSPDNLLFCFIGTVIGTLVGVLPGIGPIGAMALLLPVSFSMAPLGSFIMLAGIYYGAMYGGSTTSILVNIPGEAASVVTCLDGYQMARQGRAGPALGIAAFGSFIAGTLSIVGLMFLARPLSSVALRFGPPEYFALMCLGLFLVIYMAQKSIERALMAGLAGLLLSWVGMDSTTGVARFTFGVNELNDGIGVVPLVMGLFGVSEVLANVEEAVGQEVLRTKLKNLLPSIEDWRKSTLPIIRGSIVGFFLGILPGGGTIVSSFVSYTMEKRLSKHPERFGTGEIAGVAGPESANNAAVGGAFIPLLSLGIPPNAVIAVLFSALLIHGVRPGPLLISEHADIFWGIMASMYAGNFFLLLLNLPAIGLWVKVLQIPYRLLAPLILLFCLIGAYSVSSSVLDLKLMLGFGVLGYMMRRLDYEPAPLCLAFILGPLLETSLQQSLIISQGSFTIFFVRPIAAVCFAITLLLVVSAFLKPVATGLTKIKAFGDETN